MRRAVRAPALASRDLGRFALACVATSCGKYDWELTCCDTCLDSVEICRLAISSPPNPGGTAAEPLCGVRL
jgi:hypothetical protein